MREAHGTQGDKIALFWLKELKERDYLEELDMTLYGMLLTKRIFKT